MSVLSQRAGDVGRDRSSPSELNNYAYYATVRVASTMRCGDFGKFAAFHLARCPNDTVNDTAGSSTRPTMGRRFVGNYARVPVKTGRSRAGRSGQT